MQSTITLGRRSERMARVGIVDIGSNTVRLVVFDGSARVPFILFNEKSACGLGRGLAASGLLSPQGVEQAKSALTRFERMAEAMGLDQVYIVATAAVREAEDGNEFATWVASLFGQSVEVLSGEEEARMAAEGVLSSSPQADGLVGDMGGGSLDLVELNNGVFARSNTFPFGHLKVSELARNGFAAARKTVADGFDGLGWLPEIAGRDLHVVGGSWRAIASLMMNLTAHPLHIVDNYQLPGGQVLDLLDQTILNKNWLKNKHGYRISSKRVASLPHAGMVLSELVAITRPKSVVFSGYGVREGRFLKGLTDAARREDPLISGCTTLMRHRARFGVQGYEVHNWMSPLFTDEDERKARIRLAACLLGDIVWADHPDYRAEHALLRVSRLPVPGLSHEERVQMAIAVTHRYSGGRDLDLKAGLMSLLNAERLRDAVMVGNALRLAHILSGSVPGLLSTTRLVPRNNKLILELPLTGAVYTSETVERRLRILAETAGFEDSKVK